MARTPFALGPDGKLYVIAGNFTEAARRTTIPTSPHRNWAEDQLLPRNPDGGGHDPHIMAPGGWVARTDPDGKNWELLCAGFRNPYDIDFNTDGELFTYDSDMEWDTGTPWYRPTRVNHLVLRRRVRLAKRHRQMARVFARQPRRGRQHRPRLADRHRVRHRGEVPRRSISGPCSSTTGPTARSTRST